MTVNTICPRTHVPRRPSHRHDLTAVLPELARRVLAAEFTTLDEVAVAFGIDKATASRWKDKTVAGGLLDARAWRCAFLQARLSREGAT